MHTRSTWLVLVEQIAGEEDEIDLLLNSKLEDLAKGVDGILSTDGVLLGIPDMIVCGEQDAEAAVGGCVSVWKPGKVAKANGGGTMGGKEWRNAAAPGYPAVQAIQDNWERDERKPTLGTL